MDVRRKIDIVFGVVIVAVLLFGIIAFLKHSSFLLDSIVAVAMCIIAYAARGKLIFSWEGALLLALGMLMNLAGVFDAYSLSFLGIGWDKLIHVATTSGLVVLTFAYFRHRGTRMSSIELGIIAFFIAQGFGAVNEVVEFIGTYYFGSVQGFFSMANNAAAFAKGLEQYDTQWDMFMNMVGASLGMLYVMMKRDKASPAGR